MSVIEVYLLLKKLNLVEDFIEYFESKKDTNQ